MCGCKFLLYVVANALNSNDAADIYINAPESLYVQFAIISG